MDTMTKFKLEQKKRDIVNGVKDTFWKGVYFVEDHPQAAAAVGVGLAAGVKIATKVVSGYKTHAEVNHRNCEHYDPRAGEYFVSRRKLTPSEQDELNRLYRSGMTKGEALNRMGLRK